MQIDRNLILRLENLAKLELSESERQQLTADLTDILEMVDKMEQLDTGGVKPLVYLEPEPGHLRKDEISGQATPSIALKNAPSHDSVYFKVPKVLS